jgi:hypothetical protein
MASVGVCWMYGAELWTVMPIIIINSCPLSPEGMDRRE